MRTTKRRSYRLDQRLGWEESKKFKPKSEHVKACEGRARFKRLHPLSSTRREWPVVNSMKEAKQERKESLIVLGFTSYKSYLGSEEYAEIRKRVFSESGDDCFGCGGMAMVIHHSDYRLVTMAGKNDQALFCLCDRCHERAHDGGMCRLPLKADGTMGEWLSDKRKKRRQRKKKR